MEHHAVLEVSRSDRSHSSSCAALLTHPITRTPPPPPPRYAPSVLSGKPAPHSYLPSDRIRIDTVDFFYSFLKELLPALAA